MSKVALLIGIGKYKAAGWLPLPGTQRDIQEMKKVLEHPQMGAFDRVDLLHNPDMRTMQRAIERLFLENRQKDDLILLYFAGHGFKDEKGRLFFVTQDTEKISQQQISTGTAVPASLLHDYMEQCYSKRQVLILDCCFSGAFAEGMTARGEEAVNIEERLGGEGRAVLTASTALQKTYESKNGGVYTQYLIEGITSGAADVNNDGAITVDELHQYAKQKIQEAKREIKPGIYAVREGYTIKLAKAPLRDIEVEYCKEVERLVNQGSFREDTDQFIAPARTVLDQRRQTFRLSIEVAQLIEAKVLQPLREAYLQNYQLKLQQYEKTLRDTLAEVEYPFDEITNNDLKDCQKLLKLLDKDVQAIAVRVLPKLRILNQPLENDSQRVEKISAFSVETTQTLKTRTLPLLKTENHGSEFEELFSECDIDYTLLQDLLKKGKWKAADLETARMMLNIATQEKHKFIAEQKFLGKADIQNFPCADLHTIDSLWLRYSKNKFGLSVQTKIWTGISLEVGQAEIFKEAKKFYNFDKDKDKKWFLDAVYSKLVFEKFAKTVQWTKGSYLPDHIYFNRPNLDPLFYNRRQQQEYDLNRNFLPYNSVNFSLDSVIGHLPTIPGWQPRIYYFLPGISRGFLGTGRNFRYFLIDGEVEQPKAELVDYKQLKTKLADQPFLIRYPSELSVQTHYFSAFASQLESCRPSA